MKGVSNEKMKKRKNGGTQGRKEDRTTRLKDERAKGREDEEK